MKCTYQAKIFKHDGSEYNVINSFKIIELVDSNVLISDYIIKCHALADNFNIGDAATTNDVTILDWELVI